MVLVERLGDSSDLTLSFLSFLPGAGEAVGVAMVRLSLGVADRSTGGRSVMFTVLYCSLLPLILLSKSKSPQPHLILVLYEGWECLRL